jgi:hypothetical protein
MEPKYDETPLAWTAEMRDRAAVQASQRHMTLQVWLREAIREKLERDESAAPEQRQPPR